MTIGRSGIATADDAVDDEVVVTDLSIDYDGIPAVRHAQFSIGKGRVLALVGESGSGKSTLALALCRLLPANAAIVGGQVRVGDVTLTELSGRTLRASRGRITAYLPQDALTSLNPSMRVGNQIAEAVRMARRCTAREASGAAVDLLDQVQIADPAMVAKKYPHQLSGGMRQRVTIAIALAGEPQVLVADEPTTALDVTVQAQVLRVVAELQRARGLTVVWITHDMSVVAEVADEVAVVYGGRVVEQGLAEEIFSRPRHPYTRALLSCASYGDASAGDYRFPTIPGEPPVRERPAGCPFHPRCPLATDICATIMPETEPVASRHTVACHHWEDR